MRYSSATFKNLNDTSKKQVLAILDPETKKFKKGLFVFGPTGRGKTYLFYAIREKLDPTTTSDVETWQSLLYEMKESFGKNNYRQTLKNFMSKEVIMLDDVGVEKDSEWSQEMFYMVINEAYVYEKTLFINTNLTLEEFAQRYGNRNIDRLREMCEFYEMSGLNYRDTK